MRRKALWCKYAISSEVDPQTRHGEAKGEMVACHSPGVPRVGGGGDSWPSRRVTLGGRADSQTQDMDISPASSGTPGQEGRSGLLVSPSQVTLASLPRMMSQLAGSQGLPNLDDMSPQEGEASSGCEAAYS